MVTSWSTHTQKSGKCSHNMVRCQLSAAVRTYAHGCNPGLCLEDPQSSAAVLVVGHMGRSLSGQTHTHNHTHTCHREDRKDDTVCPGLEPLRTRWMDTRTQIYTFTHTQQAVGTLTFCPGNGSGCYGRFWAPTAPYGQCVFLCERASVFEGRRLGAGG